jgi:site-specific DNA-adenine methylase
VLSGLGEDDFVYLDPPYYGAKVNGYRSDDINHSEMIEVLKAAKFRWMLSEYRQPFYTEAFGDPYCEMTVQLRSTNFHDDGGKERRVECVWRNY